MSKIIPLATGESELPHDPVSAGKCVRRAQQLLRLRSHRAAYEYVYRILMGQMKYEPDLQGENHPEGGVLFTLSGRIRNTRRQPSGKVVEQIEDNLEWICQNVALEILELLGSDNERRYIRAGYYLMGISLRALWHFDPEFRLEVEPLHNDPLMKNLFVEIPQMNPETIPELRRVEKV